MAREKRQARPRDDRDQSRDGCGRSGQGVERPNISLRAPRLSSPLQTDRIDLYFSHLDDQETPLAETLAEHEKLLRDDKVRAVGASNYNGASAGSNENETIDTVLRSHYNLIERADYETDLAPVVSEYGLGVVPYFALAAGFFQAISQRERR